MRVAGSSPRRSPHSLSEQERHVLHHDDDLRAEAAALRILRPLVLTWLEAAVLLHHYTYGWRLPQVGEILDRPRSEVFRARDSLVRKAAIALGYIPGEVEMGEVEMTTEERREAVAWLRRAGMNWAEIGRRLGVSTTTIHADVRALREAGVALPEPPRRGSIRERRKARADGTFYCYWEGSVSIHGRVRHVTGRTREEVEQKLAGVLADAQAG